MTKKEIREILLELLKKDKETREVIVSIMDKVEADEWDEKKPIRDLTK